MLTHMCKHALALFILVTTVAFSTNAYPSPSSFDALFTLTESEQVDTLLSRNFQVMLENGKAEFKQERYREAARYLEAAVALNPESAEAHYFLGYTYGRLSSPEGGQIPNARLDYTLKATEHLRRTIQLSPKYSGEMVVVDPYSRITADWSVLAMSYMSRGESDSAGWAFERGQEAGGFLPALLEINRNIMASCQNDAILLVNGDNDTFPMWYLQFVEGFRRDITVVNINLLNAAWYAKLLKNGYPFGDNNAPLSLNDAAIDSLMPDYWSEKIECIDVPQSSPNAQGKMEWVLKPTAEYEGRGIIRVQDYLLLDLFRSNGWKRPIYFSTTIGQADHMSLDDYLSFEGLVYRLLSHQPQALDIEILHQNCLDIYSYAALQDTNLLNYGDVLRLAENYRHCFLLLTRLYGEKGEIQKAQATLEAMNEKIPAQPGSSGYWVDVGWGNYAVGKYEDCIKASAKAFDLDSSAINAQYNIALSYLCLGNMDRARATYAQAKKLDDRSAAGAWTRSAIQDLEELITKGVQRTEAESILKEIFNAR